MNGLTTTSKQMTIGMGSGELSTLSPPQAAVVKSRALEGFFVGLLITAAIGGAAVITTLTAMAFATMGKAKKGRKRK